jgi:hypothetical protein
MGKGGGSTADTPYLGIPYGEKTKPDFPIVLFDGHRSEEV